MPGPIAQPCEHCINSSVVSQIIDVPCPKCGGSGEEEVIAPHGNITRPCSWCHGKRYTLRYIKCEWCMGLGWHY